MNVNVTVFFEDGGKVFLILRWCVCGLAGIPTVYDGRVDVHVQGECFDDNGQIW